MILHTLSAKPGMLRVWEKVREGGGGIIDKKENQTKGVDRRERERERERDRKGKEFLLEAFKLIELLELWQTLK